MVLAPKLLVVVCLRNKCTCFAGALVTFRSAEIAHARLKRIFLRDLEGVPFP